MSGFQLNCFRELTDSYWGNCFYSTFEQIYDEKHFIDSLAHDVRIVHKLPDEILHHYGNLSNIFNFKIKAWAQTRYYLDKVLPKLQETG